VAKRKTSALPPVALPPLTPRAREVVNLVVNSVALGVHDNDAEVGAIAAQLGMSPARLASMLRKLEDQGYVTIKNDFVYPTVTALRWQNPTLSEQEAKHVLRSLR
jgi:DNA-binding IclR family transcriptional regulator